MSQEIFRDLVRTMSAAYIARRKPDPMEAAFALLKTYEMDPNCVLWRKPDELWSMAFELCCWAFESQGAADKLPAWWKEKVK